MLKKNRALSFVAIVAGAGFLFWKLRTPRGTVEVLEVGALAALDLQMYSPIISALDLVGFDMRPRGIRNNNPGNMRPDGRSNWLGMTGVDSGGYLIFDKPENGIRAMARDLKNKAARGVDTVREVITAWAPAFENNTSAYVSAVARACGVGPDQVPNRMLLIKAIIQHENGQQPYTDAQIIAGINAA